MPRVRVRPGRPVALGARRDRRHLRSGRDTRLSGPDNARGQFYPPGPSATLVIHGTVTEATRRVATPHGPARSPAGGMAGATHQFKEEHPWPTCWPRATTSSTPENPPVER
ncbi:hypothetical protein ACFPM0_01640 [Pseudonocardia sulfidoxydans]|uniref:hypothetical protein n=1 Tax=Pseudonocardia sulfidoxydans TaxID=54011 RepID=UPI0036075B9A